MNNCEYYENLLRALPERKLSDDERNALRSHLNECSSCRRLFNDLHTQYTAQRGQTPAPAPMRNTPPKKEKSPLRFVLPVLIVCLLAAAAVFVLHSCGKSNADLSESTTYTDTDADAENTPIVIAAFDPETETQAVSNDNGAVTTDTPSDTDSAAAVQTGSSNIGLYTVDNPAAVPDGQDSAFEALLTSDGSDADPAALNSICAAEYHGVIYEFLTDADGALYWRDAAEGVTAQRSTGSTDDLWGVLGLA